jgi:hypothetical protein
VLRLQKNALLSRVAEIEAAAVAAIVAPGRRRLFNMREDQIRIADADRAAMLAEKRVKPGLLKKLTGAATEEDIAAAVAEQRPAEDTKHLAEQEERRRRVREVEQLAAQAMHDIEDLTAETIGSWQAPDFSGV